MMADTNVAFGEEVVLLDVREAATVSASGTSITLTTQASKVSIEPDSDSKAYTISGDDILMGAMLEITNTHASNKLTVNSIEVAAGATKKIYYSGKSWFDAKEVDVKITQVSPQQVQVVGTVETTTKEQA